MKSSAPLSQQARDLRALIAKGWTTGTPARSAGYRQVNVHSKEACRFCLLGGIARVTGTRVYLPEATVPALFRLVAAVVARECQTKLSNYDLENAIYTFNDGKGRKQEEVLEMLDEVVAWAEGAESAGLEIV